MSGESKSTLAILPQLSINMKDRDTEVEITPSSNPVSDKPLTEEEIRNNEINDKIQAAEAKADEQRAKRAKLLGEDNLYSTMWKLTYPDLIGKLVAACYTLADAVFISNMAGETVAERSISLASISFTMPLEQAFIAGCGLLGTIGFSSTYSRYLGENNLFMARNTLGNIYLCCIIIGILIPCILIPLLRPLLMLIGASDEAGTLPSAMQYLTVLAACDIVSNCQFASNNMTRAEGSAAYSALLMVTGAVINIILDPIFIKVLGLSLTGAAVATVCGQFVSSLAGLYYFLGGKSVVTFDKKCWKPNPKILGVALNVGFSAFISSISGAIVTIISNRLILYFAPYGPTAIETTEIVSVSGALGKFSFFVFLPMLSMSHGVLPILAFCKGAKLYERFMAGVKACLVVSLCLGIVLCILGYVLAPYVALMFSSSPTFVETFTIAMRYMTSTIPLNSVLTAVMPALQACGHGTPAAVMMFCRQCLALLLAEVLICYADNTFWGCFMAYPIADLFTFIVSVIYYFYYYNEFAGFKDKDYQMMKNSDIEMKPITNTDEGERNQTNNDINVNLAILSQTTNTEETKTPDSTSITVDKE